MIPISPMIRRNFKKLFEQNMLMKFFFITIIQKNIHCQSTFSKSKYKMNIKHMFYKINNFGPM